MRKARTISFVPYLNGWKIRLKQKERREKEQKIDYVKYQCHSEYRKCVELVYISYTRVTNFLLLLSVWLPFYITVVIVIIIGWNDFEFPMTEIQWKRARVWLCTLKLHLFKLSWIVLISTYTQWFTNVGDCSQRWGEMLSDKSQMCESIAKLCAAVQFDRMWHLNVSIEIDQFCSSVN